MSDKVWIGSNASSLDTAPCFEPYSKVVLWYDDEKAFTAGDDTGRTLEADCPWATQAIADKILQSVNGYAYQPFSATEAILDPAAELGDGVTVGGVYGQLASIDTVFDIAASANISAPSDEEVDHEYPYLSPEQRELKRKVTLGTSYYGTKITRANGLEIIKTVDGVSKSRAVLNSDVFALYDDNGNEALYFDTNAGRFKFTGFLDVAGNFIVDKKGDVTVNGNLNIVDGKIRASKNSNVYAQMEDEAFALKAVGVTKERAILQASNTSVRLVLGTGTSPDSDINGRMVIEKDTTGGNVIYTTSNGKEAGFILNDDATLDFLCPICLYPDSYGTTLPTSGKPGQLFFLLS